MARVTNNHNEDLTVIRRGQESMNNLLGEIEQFMTAVKGRNNDVKEQLDELKHNQQMLN
jgi:archaellum component FlaC